MKAAYGDNSLICIGWHPTGADGQSAGRMIAILSGGNAIWNWSKKNKVQKNRCCALRQGCCHIVSMDRAWRPKRQQRRRLTRQAGSTAATNSCHPPSRSAAIPAKFPRADSGLLERIIYATPCANSTLHQRQRAPRWRPPSAQNARKPELRGECAHEGPRVIEGLP